jgi:hypothetical protein
MVKQVPRKRSAQPVFFLPWLLCNPLRSQLVRVRPLGQAARLSSRLSAPPRLWVQLGLNGLSDLTREEFRAAYLGQRSPPANAAEPG